METTQFNYGQRQKRRRVLSNKKDSKSSINTYLYPKNNLYTRQEFELLDSIYSDEPPTSLWEEDHLREQTRRNYTGTFNKRDFFGKVGYLVTGMMLTSVIWLIYLQFHDHTLRTKSDTQIVFQKSAEIITHESVDKQVTKELKSTRAQSWTNFFVAGPKKVEAQTPKPVIKTEVVKEVKPAEPQVQPVKYHTIQNGDSLWLIANKYYSNPSPENINKIMKANKLRATGILSLGQKIVIP